MQTHSAKWPDSLLADMRSVGDPLADATIQTVFEHGDIGAVNALLTSLIRNDQVIPDNLDPAVRDYLDATRATPIVQPDLVEATEKFFVAHGNLALFVLVCASLPECYVMKKGVNVLWLTQRLEAHVLRRLLETAQMVLRVMSPGGMAPQGLGIQAAAKVRLMHAAIRHLILHPRPPATSEPATTMPQVFTSVQWDTNALGYPINQMDLAYTLLTFSYVIPRSLEKLGVPISPAEKNAFIHTWNIVGSVMGIRDDMMPADYDEATWLFERIKDLEGGASQAGRDMTAAVVKCLQDALHGRLFDSVPTLLMYELLDDRTREWLDIGKPGFLAQAAEKMLVSHIRAAALAKNASGHLVLTPRIWHWLAGHMTTYLTNYKQPPGWNRAVFEIPTDIAAQWSVPKFDDA